jgi:hypothetical protein
MGWVVNATPRPLYTRERPGTHCIGGWVGHRTGLDECGKSRPASEFDPRTFQPVASLYTDWAIPVHLKDNVTYVSWRLPHYCPNSASKAAAAVYLSVCIRRFFGQQYVLVGSQNSSVGVMINLKTDSHIACRSHAVPLPCRAAMGLECVFPTWFTQCGRVWFTLHIFMNQSRPHCVNQMGKTHSKPLEARHGRGTAWARHAMCESALTDLKMWIPFLFLTEIKAN